MRKLIGLLLVALLALPALAGAATVDDLEKKMQELQKQIDELSASANKGELHAATDRIQFYGDLRTKADSLTYRDVRWFIPGAPPTALKYNLNNSILYTTRLRLNMKAKVWDNVDFAGRLSMYKNWGDSTSVKVMDSFTGVTMDGTNSGNTTGDTLRVERAYFNWKDIGGSNFYLSIGRRPSTYGPPTQYRENELRGGTPSGHLVNFNFDGVTAGYHLSELTGIEGQTIRFCYGQGYESDLGNGELMGNQSLKDTHLGGFNIDALDDGTNFVQLTLFRAQDITDGFKSLAVLQDASGLPVVVRMQATTNVGNMWIGGLGLAREEDNGLKYFASFGWNQSDPNGRVSQFPTMFGGPAFGGLLSEDGKGKENGYSVYAGIQIPTGDIGKIGFEYNYGSQYWFNFVQAQDDIAGPKLAARGHVGEAYYIFDINPNMFIKIGGLFYDYQYTGSGNPIGKPTKISALTGYEFHSMMPVIDKVYDGYASMTVKF
jgi:hypothetical protein